MYQNIIKKIKQSFSLYDVVSNENKIVSKFELKNFSD